VVAAIVPANAAAVGGVGGSGSGGREHKAARVVVVRHEMERGHRHLVVQPTVAIAIAPPAATATTIPACCRGGSGLCPCWAVCRERYPADHAHHTHLQK
jgi:hypothetical protein